MASNYKSNRKAVDGALKASQLGALTAIGTFVEGETKARSAVDTGNYRDAWGYRVDGTAVTIGNGVEYAIYLEKGTSQMPAQPALQPSVESNAGRIQELVKGAWRM
ncbi:HK97 gp10 family phage protein [Planomicrobium soli]|uniref:HK97 gp10 family phage protein n=1 Tax=Planomicrobium soli TaxID=1176648 RepID=A0A2P8H7C8_9BACL|nr:HK97-gp10 family putative phage morphogenesis protein [Planomicrobium soli]PSL42128.1 HK97 gp10 family phage protein [Planomicrobium soli]